VNTTLPISVVIPTYNYGRFVGEAIDSALGQTMPPLEVVVVDDGSTDDTRERLAKYGDRIKYVHQANRGLSGARNTGIRKARGEWIALLDSDDLWHPQKLEHLAVALAVQPDLQAIATDTVVFSDTIPALPPVVATPDKLRTITLRDLIYGVHFSGGSGAMIRRACFDKIGLFDETLRAVEDLDMWIRIASEFKMARLLEPLTVVRVHPTSMSAQAVSMEANHRRAIGKLFTTVPVLQGRIVWKQIALARMHRGVAWMHFEAGNRWRAIGSVGLSFLAWPFTSGDANRFTRCKMIVRYLLT
jgi:glycosyltransferase involved in cell wall biosynthesis